MAICRKARPDWYCVVLCNDLALQCTLPQQVQVVVTLAQVVVTRRAALQVASTPKAKSTRPSRACRLLQDWGCTVGHLTFAFWGSSAGCPWVKVPPQIPCHLLKPGHNDVAVHDSHQGCKHAMVDVGVFDLDAAWRVASLATCSRVHHAARVTICGDPQLSAAIANNQVIQHGRCVPYAYAPWAHAGPHAGPHAARRECTRTRMNNHARTHASADRPSSRGAADKSPKDSGVH